MVVYLSKAWGSLAGRRHLHMVRGRENPPTPSLPWLWLWHVEGGPTPGGERASRFGLQQTIPPPLTSVRASGFGVRSGNVRRGSEPSILAVWRRAYWTTFSTVCISH